MSALLQSISLPLPRTSSWSDGAPSNLATPPKRLTDIPHTRLRSPSVSSTIELLSLQTPHSPLSLPIEAPNDPTTPPNTTPDVPLTQHALSSVALSSSPQPPSLIQQLRCHIPDAPNASGIALTIVTLIVGALLTHYGNDLSLEQLDLAQWTAEKDYRETCEKNLGNGKITPECQNILKYLLQPPPHTTADRQVSKPAFRRMMAAIPSPRFEFIPGQPDIDGQNRPNGLTVAIVATVVIMYGLFNAWVILKPEKKIQPEPFGSSRENDIGNHDQTFLRQTKISPLHRHITSAKQQARVISMFMIFIIIFIPFIIGKHYFSWSPHEASLRWRRSLCVCYRQNVVVVHTCTILKPIVRWYRSWFKRWTKASRRQIQQGSQKLPLTTK